MPRETPKKRLSEVMEDLEKRFRPAFKKGKKPKYKSAADAKKRN